MKINELHNQPVQPDTYEASMAQNQLLKIGTHSIQIHNLLKNEQEMESWVAKKIDLASNYVKSVHGFTAGSKAGAYDDDGMSEDASGWKLVSQAKEIAKKMAGNYSGAVRQIEKLQKDLSKNTSVEKALLQFNEDQSVRISTDVEGEWGGTLGKLLDRDDDGNVLVGFGKEAQWFKQDDVDFNDEDFGPGEEDDDVLDIGFDEDAGEKIANMAQNMSKDEFMSHADELGLTPEEAAEHYEKMSGGAHAGKFENAGEGHMSKSQLYQTAKMAIELIEMIKHGDDLEAWVQTKLNLAADYLQAVHHYEEYQKLNPYREQIDSNTFTKHSEIVKKNIDEILARETQIDDVDTKPGMMRILGKRVNDVEKKIAKENRKQADEDAAGVGIITKQNTTSDVKPGDEYKNVKKLGLKSSAYESKLTDMLKQRLK